MFAIWDIGYGGFVNETGIIEEIRLEDAVRNPHRAWELFDLTLYDLCMREAKLELLLDSDLYAEAVEIFGEKGLVEMVTVMGDYLMVGMVLTAIDQHLPPDRPALLPQ